MSIRFFLFMRHYTLSKEHAIFSLMRSKRSSHGSSLFPACRRNSLSISILLARTPTFFQVSSPRILAGVTLSSRYSRSRSRNLSASGLMTGWSRVWTRRSISTACWEVFPSSRIWGMRPILAVNICSAFTTPWF